MQRNLDNAVELIIPDVKCDLKECWSTYPVYQTQADFMILVVVFIV